MPFCLQVYNTCTQSVYVNVKAVHLKENKPETLLVESLAKLMPNNNNVQTSGCLAGLNMENTRVLLHIT